jgi:hypothetical protein
MYLKVWNIAFIDILKIKCTLNEWNMILICCVMDFQGPKTCN